VAKYYNVIVSVEVLVEGKDHEDGALNARNLVANAIECKPTSQWCCIHKVEVIHEREE
jgi:hypothetical protein